MRAWRRRGPVACLLWPLSCLLGMLAAVRRGGYATGLLRSTRLPVPVIVVGNIFVGGTGKTPFTIWLVSQMRRAGYVPGVISRGYGTRHAQSYAVTPDSLPQESGDEPLLIARRTGCPVMIGRDRVAAGQALLAAHPEVNVIISDDGLQHYALRRDVEIVLHDSRGIGNGWLLPAGPLREPARRRRDHTVINGADSAPGVPASAIRMTLVPDLAYALSDPALRRPLSAFADASSANPARIVSAAGIGNPGRFFSMLREAGVHFTEMPLQDHFDYEENPFVDVAADIILITEKDAVKCSRKSALMNDRRLWVVPVTAVVDPGLAENIVEKCRGYPTA